MVKLFETHRLPFSRMELNLKSQDFFEYTLGSGVCLVSGVRIEGPLRILEQLRQASVVSAPRFHSPGETHSLPIPPSTGLLATMA
ncbi:hypothetical protein VTN49DRAFT_881 [Thermomyces lanuginosus]|uniref:uncharacterized protein n=1 Tax=Thermomyces lanuginosus TaxID=5541 RepID=UPI0037447101